MLATVVLLVASCLLCWESSGLQCDYAVAPSLETGLGLFAVQQLSSGQLLEQSIGVPVPLAAIYWTQLVNYAEGFNESHCLLSLGNALLLNHHHNYRSFVNVWKAMSPYPSLLSFRSPYKSSIDLLYEYTIDVQPNQQLLIDYGFDWFEQRGLTYHPPQEFYGQQDFFKSTGEDSSYDTSIDIKGDINNPNDWKLSPNVRSATSRLGWPICTSQFSVLLEGEVFATVDIPANTIIEVTRALLLPVTRSLIFAGPLEEVLWWAMDANEHTNQQFHQISESTIRRPSNPYQVEPFDPDSKYAILLTGSGPFYASKDNSAYDSNYFHQIDGNVKFEFLSMNPDDDARCSTSMILIVRAVRSISAAEKLTISYSIGLHRRRLIGEELLRQCAKLEE